MVWLTVIAGCSAPALPPDYYKAERLERQGRFAEAQQLYDKAARGCKKKPLACATTATRSAQMLVKLGRKREAITAYLKIAHGVGRSLREGARAQTRAGQLLSELGEWGRAEALWWSVIDDFPNALAADDALLWLVQRYRSQKRLAALVSMLRERYRRLRYYDIADNFLFTAARLLERELQRPDRAVALYLLLARTYKTSGFRDDAFFLAAGIRRKQGRFWDAILIYKELLATREDAFSSASYHSEYLDDSQFEIARIWLLDFHKPAEAVKQFREVITGFPTSVLRDDAQWWIVLSEVEQGRDEEAHKAVQELAKKYPDSRFCREAKHLPGWIALRRAARAHRRAEACRLWQTLNAAHPFSWLVRHGPRPKPWPVCGTESGRPPTGTLGSRRGA